MAGAKHQEKTFLPNGNAVGLKSYIKPNSATHLRGTQNGDVRAKSISSTQKIGEGHYQLSLTKPDKY
ncbi:MAG: hypothetical protein R2822_16280 [Spirosomataceae bacterium]